MIRTIILLAACAAMVQAAEWGEPVEVRYDTTLCVTYRARLAGDYLLVEASHEPGWHTNAMDNKVRVAEKLAGKPALGIDAPTEITASEGLQVTGPWYQPAPRDMSRPELRMFTWGFDGQALFAARVRRTGSGAARITVRGQACTESLCKQIDVAVPVPPNRARTAPPDLSKLVRVRAAR